jgi:hypothetical protein
MKLTTTKLLTFLLALAIFSCNNPASTPGTAAPETTAPGVDTTGAAANMPGQETVMSLKAMFVEFSLGDAEHFTFKDESGKTWDFGGCEDQSVPFAQELPAPEANESNQGWTSNKELQNKWFDLKYVIRKQPEYVDGPIGDVPVIVEAKPAE